ncbi:taste receptor type 1 member 3 [Lampris incognitus]|uniref:taste receptor type 1 member 3 n=1 Tax=Lampris incognitus TaxID=2546036 RepID=UPI0024B5C125|nr:taste receptor type 1 member 3 [Lampris incognitus]
MAVPPQLLVLCWMFGLGCCQNSHSWLHNIPTSLFNLSGDILLGGLFPINLFTGNRSQSEMPNDISCNSVNEVGLGLAIVMKYTVDEINANQMLLPGIKLGYEIFDTCSQSSIIVKSTVYFLTEKSTGNLAVKCNYTNYEPRMAAVIGPATSEMVSVIGKLLGFFLMPQISYGATSETFSNRYLYPSFLRTVPGDKWQAEAMLHLLREFNWNWVALVGSDEEYGRKGLDEVSRLAVKMSICVAYKGLIPIYSEAEPVVRNILDNIKATKVGVVVIFSLAPSVEIFFKEVIRRNMTGVWIGSTAWAFSDRLTLLPNIHTVGTIIGFADRTQTLDSLTNYTEVLLSKLSGSLSSQALPSATVGPYGPCPQCWTLSPANISVVTTPSVQRGAYNVYTAIYSVAQALHKLLGCNATNCVWGAESKIRPWQLLEVLKNNPLEMNGTHFAFDSSGSLNKSYDLVEWVWKNASLHFINVGTFNNKLLLNKTLLTWHMANSGVPQSTCSAECVAGQVRRVKGFHSCCFDCINCLEGTFQAGKDDIQCTNCPEGQWSLMRSTNCSHPTFDILSWDKPESVGMMLAGLMLLMCQGSVGLLFLKYRGTPLVNASGGALSGVVLLSLSAGCLSQLLFLGQPGDLVCRLQLPLTSIFPTVALSIITAISLQILYINEFPQKATSHLDMRGLGVWLLVIICCCVQAGLCGWYVQRAILQSEHLAQLKIRFLRWFLTCPAEPALGFGLMQGFNCGLALISFMSTFMAAKPLRQYNLARDITFSSLIYCVIWVIFIPIYAGMSDKHRSFIQMSFNLVSNMELVAAYYFPKCYLLLSKPELNTSAHFCTFLEGAPPTPTEEEQQSPSPQSEQETQYSQEE